MKDMGEANVILGIKIKRENKGIVITQSHYIKKILKKFNREDCSPVSTLMNLVEKHKPNTGKPIDQLEYSRAIGCLMYAMTSTRPYIAYDVGRLSRFTSNPSRQHWKAITKVFKYLRGTKDYGLSYVGYPSVLEAPYTPQQNGVAEKKNKALKEMVNSMLSYSGLSERFWGKAIIEEDPRTYNKALQSRDSSFWKEAIDDEICSIMVNNTCVLSDLPPGCKPLGCKWIFKRKMKVDGIVDKFKA
nr:zinc finger, CCHC-type [Tanacetum cinerariifolium]